MLEDDVVSYTIKTRVTKRIEEAINGAVFREISDETEPLQIQGAEVTVKLSGWSRPRRVVIVRIREGTSPASGQGRCRADPWSHPGRIGHHRATWTGATSAYRMWARFYTEVHVALSIKNDEADALARELAALTGESLTKAVVLSLRERLDRKRAASDRRPLADRLMEIGRACAALPLLDARTPDEILGYDQHGLPA